MPDLALFDFDGTITDGDSFTAFVYNVVAPARLRLGMLVLSPLIAAYYLGLLPATRLRRAIVRVGLAGRRQAEIDALGARFAREVLPGLVRPASRERLDWHRARGDDVVVVSASLAPYLRPWCVAEGCALICTELEADGGILTGRYLGRDCTAAEKARRVRLKFPLASYATIYAYGDTKEDEELLALASERFFRGVRRDTFQ